MSKLPAITAKDVIFYAMIALVLIVVALSGTFQRAANDLAAITPEPTPSPSATPASSPTPLPGAELNSFLEALESAGLRVSESSNENTVVLRDPDRSGRMELRYSTTGENISAFSLDFTLLPAPTPTPYIKPGWQLRNLVEAHAQKALAEENASLERFLSVLIPALCQDAPPPSAVILRWYDGALSARDKNAAYEDRYENLTFSADRTFDGGKEILRCSLICD